jgi:hypothetical protein
MNAILLKFAAVKYQLTVGKVVEKAYGFGTGI